MQSRFISNNRFVGEQEEDNTPECGSESPPCSSFNDMKTPSALSSKKRRAMQKRVVSVPIKDVEGSKLKGDGAPPSDSWAWRKYGQKPIKGSPYPRGYYRCSSSKGCPARKQVERSSVDPSMLLITYSCDHNHPWPLPSRSHHSNSKHAKPEPQPDPEPKREPEDKFSDLADDHALISASADEFTWFSEMETTTSTVLESPIFSERTVGDSSDVAMFFPMREEDESLFADLGELPECSSVFRHRNFGPEVQIC